MTNSPVPIRTLVRVRGRFHRSVHLPRDFPGWRRPDEYLATPALLDIANEMVAELARSGGTRAWTLTGPYGSGKSAFALFLTDLLANTRPRHPQGRDLRGRHSRYLRNAAPLRPLLVQAERGPLLAPILRTLARSDATPAIARRAERLARSTTSGTAGVDLLADAAACSPGGFLLVIDELGKFLEYAAGVNGDGRAPGDDVFLLQQLAEAAARSEKPFVVVGVLHSGFADYVTDSGSVLRAEWQKVQGRFQDIPFALPGEQLLTLVGHALHTDLDKEAGVDSAYRRRFARITATPALKPTLESRGLRSELSACLPLHPVAALLLWPLFRSKIAQNERSLFAFLTSHEPGGFQAFLRNETVSAAAPLFGLPALYDYVATTLGPAVSIGRDARHWTLIGHALDRVPADAPPLVSAVAKSIGLLALYGDETGLPASADLLEAVFDDHPASCVRDALAVLARESIVVFRRHRRAYGLWEGSDVDLDDCFDTARNRCCGRSLAARLTGMCNPQPLLARAHYVETGTLRLFDTRLAEFDAESVKTALAESTTADGVVLFLLDSVLDVQTRNHRAEQISRSIRHQRPVLIAVPQDGARLETALDERECWRWVQENVAELEGDPVGRREADVRTQAARDRFEQVAGPLFGLRGHVLDPAACTWFRDGRRCTPWRPRELQVLLSQLCEQTYSQAPTLRNELLNRHRLSSAAARGRRNLIERMMRDEHRERLGIDGFPPEYSMYRAMLEQGGIHHRARDGRYRLRSPARTRSTWKPAWRAVESFLAESGPRPLSELISRLQAPPFGLRAGPIPVLLLAVLRVKGEEVALYEDGLFVPDVGIETVERLLSKPGTFALRSYRLGERDRSLLEAAAGLVVAGATEARKRPSLVDIAKRLLRLASELPPFVEHTRRLSGSARVLRERLRGATDPRAMLLEDLPRDLGVDIESRDAPRAFAKALGGALDDLCGAFPRLLATVEEQLRNAFGLRRNGRELLAELRRRALPLAGRAVDPRLRLLLSAVTLDEGANGRDWREAVGRAVLDGKPPSRWRDEDVDAFMARMPALAAQCDVLTELVAAAGGEAAATVASVGVLTPGGRERRSVVACDQETGPSVANLARALQNTALGSGLDRHSQFMALALAALDLPERGAPAETPLAPPPLREAVA